MATIIPLPRSVRDLAEKNTHPGLQLDKFPLSLQVSGEGNDLVPQAGGRNFSFSEHIQRPALESVVRLSKKLSAQFNFEDLRNRRRQTNDVIGTTNITAETSGPLTLHLARASALENAGICLHPIYGFVFLPGSGNKGMTRAFAETVWLPLQSDQNEAKKTIELVFGQNSDASEENNGAAGNIVFQDAWPATMPELQVDILNSHHPKYYESTKTDDDYPGDWEDPVPVNFLSVPAGVPFEFAIHARRKPVSAEEEARNRKLIELAASWLIGALEHKGAGAKTGLGYGAFSVTECKHPESKNIADQTWKAATSLEEAAGKISGAAHRESLYRLELVTPGFFGGYDPTNDHHSYTAERDCTLREGTLKNMMRWWWRTMWAGRVNAGDLRKLEAIIWGVTDRSGAVRVVIAEGKRSAIPVPGKFMDDQNRLKPDRGFTNEHGIVSFERQPNLGLHYFSYGMDETDSSKRRRQRYCAEPESFWNVTVTCRHGVLETVREKKTIRNRIPVDLIAQQTDLALRLLCWLGGVGSKSRNGFGSFQIAVSETDPRQEVVQAIEVFAQAIAACDPSFKLNDPQGPTETPSLDSVDYVETFSPLNDPWQTMHVIGSAFQAFAQAEQSTGHGVNCYDKAALGLPRSIGKSPKIPLKGPKSNPDPKKDARHSKPISFHVSKDKAGNHVIRVAIFKTGNLWNKLPNNDENASRQAALRVLDQLKVHLEGDLQTRSQTIDAPSSSNQPRQGQTQGRRPPKQQPTTSTTHQRQGRASGTKVTVTITGIKTKMKKGEEKKSITCQEKGRVEGVISLGTPPDPLPSEGDEVQVVLHVDSPTNPQYKWQ